MTNLGEQLCRCAKHGRAKSAQRGIIVIRSRSAYDECVKHMRRAGVTPVKSIASRGMLCLHVENRREWRRLTNHPEVHYAELDVQVRAHAKSRSGTRRNKSAARLPAAIPWNIARVQAPLLWPAALGGRVRVAILDTGIGPHPNLRVAGGVNTIGGRTYRDDNGHGTHVAGIAAGLGRGGCPAGVAPRARLYAVKVLDSSGSGYISDIVEGIEWCIKRGVQVMNMSFGLPPGSTSRTLRNAIRRAASKGIVITVSAGNGGKHAGGLDVPAAYPETIAVAASTRSNRIASFSSRGKGIAVAAPGQAIRSAKPGGGCRVDSGTSMAAPHAAGGAALLLALYPRMKPAALKKRLTSAARRLAYRRTAQGSGLLQLRASAATAARRQ